MSSCLGKRPKGRAVLRVLVYKKADHMRANESGSTGDNYILHSISFRSRVNDVLYIYVLKGKL